MRDSNAGILLTDKWDDTGMTDINRQYAKQLMTAAGLDGLALFQPEAFLYAIGESGGVATMWRRAGAAIAFVPCDPKARLAAVVSDHAIVSIRRAAPDVDLRSHRIWIDSVNLTGLSCDTDNVAAMISTAYREQQLGGARPETFNASIAFGLLGDILDERQLSQARIGVDLEFMPAADFDVLKRVLPDITWVDGSDILRRLQAVKSPREIQRLRNASKAAEAGLQRLAKAAVAGADVQDLSLAWRAGAYEAATAGGFALSGHWDFISIGPDLSDMKARISPGALIKADVGTLVAGYSSDGARTFSFGPPSPVARKIFDALDTAFHAGLNRLVPGNSFGSVHEAMLAAMRQLGFDGYYRGHFGHSCGARVGIEEWPYFSAGNPELLLPGMVVALEAPFYGPGLGALMIEDMFLITETGAEPINSLPRGLMDLCAS
jgi:Xaa-Pro aminopeptidase